MKEKVRFLGLDAHAQTIAVAIAEPDGAVRSEDSSGKRMKRGSITKTGGTHLRRIVVEAAWIYRLRPGVGSALRKRQEGCRKRSRRSPGRHNNGCISATPDIAFAPATEAAIFPRNADTCRLFSSNFDQHPFQLRHGLDNMEIFKMPKLLQLAERCMPTRVHKSHFETGELVVKGYFGNKLQRG